ncbi:hypothetical protein REPUB_Repub06bG0129900 [Reevesia pubescens]
MDGAPSVSQKNQNRLISHSVTISSRSNPTPLEQLASAFFETDERNISHIDFQPVATDLRDGDIQPQSSTHHHHEFPNIHSSDHQADIFPSSTGINKAKETLLSFVNLPDLWSRNSQYYCHSLSTEKSSINANKSCWSQQGSLLSLDHTKLLAEATRNSKAKQQSPIISRNNISGNYGRSVPCGARPTSIKKRLKWTADLHHKFVNCVNLLGGAEKATPRAILKLMKSNGLTLLHVKSHLQKYRYAKFITDSTQGKPEKRVDIDDDDLAIYLKSGMQVLQMQLEVQRHLCEQLEIQQNLQQAIEEQGKQIQMMLEQLKKTNKAC